MHHFMLGAFAMAATAAAAFFFRFWLKSRERLFAALGVAFLLLALERSVLAFVPPDGDGRHWIYVARLLAFAVILLGIADKNRKAHEPR
jgi:hypothetical protein